MFARSPKVANEGRGEGQAPLCRDLSLTNGHLPTAASPIVERLSVYAISQVFDHEEIDDEENVSEVSWEQLKAAPTDKLVSELVASGIDPERLVRDFMKIASEDPTANRQS